MSAISTRTMCGIWVDDPQGDAAVRTARGGDRCARLHGHRDQPLVDVVPGEDPVRLRLRGLVVTVGELPRVALVRARVVVHGGRALLEGGPHVEHRRERLVVDLDRLERVGGLVAVARDHHRHGVPDVAHLVHGEGQVRRHHGVLGDRPDAEGADVLVAEVGTGVGGHDAGPVRAAETSTRVIRACAIGLRSTAMCSMPGRTMLSVQFVLPVTSRASSLRSSGWPTDFCRASGAASVVGHRAPPAAAACCTALTMFW